MVILLTNPLILYFMLLVLQENHFCTRCLFEITGTNLTFIDKCLKIQLIETYKRNFNDFT